jgi:hypothetical protein
VCCKSPAPDDWLPASSAMTVRILDQPPSAKVQLPEGDGLWSSGRGVLLEFVRQLAACQQRGSPPQAG